ncbi:MAG: Rpn family recombination-promoting nuclease/putative transposase (plasmid) [Candidatus Symbiodolus clandestinus]
MAKQSKKTKESATAPIGPQKPSHPHDCFFKQSMEYLPIARDWLCANLPAELVVQMNLSTLELANREIVLAGLERLQDDCVYRCQINDSTGYIVALLEHQSTAEKMMAFRTLQYAVAIMDSYLKQGKPLPVVISVVLYHGTVTPYPHSTAIWDCFENPELAKQWSLKPFHLIDLTTMSDEKIKQHGLASVMEMLMKHARDEQILHCLKKMIADGLLAIIRKKLGKPYTISIGTYVVSNCGDGTNPKELNKAIDLLANALPDVREEIMTFAQQLEQRGEQRGLQQGGHDKAFEIAKKMLEAKIDLQAIKNCTGLSEQEISRLNLH